MTSVESEVESLQAENPVEMPTGQLLGKVASPQGSEATSEEFTFWTPDDVLAEKTQIVRAIGRYRDRQIHFYGVVDEVFRRSRRRDVLEEADRFGGDVRAELHLDSQGLTYARAKILGSDPPVLTPPREEAEVYLAGEHEARIAYGVDRMRTPLPIGLLKNGASNFAGPAHIDLDYLLGANGAHLNVNGVAGVATKSSFLLCTLYRLLACCSVYAQQNPSAPDRLSIVPIVLNVKSYDLMWLDYASSRYQEAANREGPVWSGIGVVDPSPFAGARFVAPEQAAARAAVPVGRGVERYSWSLSDVVRLGTFAYLFGDEDREDENFLGLLQDIEARITREGSGEDRSRALRPDAPQTFQALVDWVGTQASSLEDARELHNHHAGTWRKLHRRLRRVVQEGEGLLVRHGRDGSPLTVTATTTQPPCVVDIQSIRDRGLQRFVVASIFAQVSEHRTGTNAIPNLVYVIVLDELNRWAPRGATDPITRLIETVVGEMRSQGVILFGAQQQASHVSPRVIENCAIRVLGRTGPMELSHDVWGFLSSSVKRRAQNLLPDEKLVYEVDFRQPMQIRAPFPAWAMRRDEAVLHQQGDTFSERQEWER